MLRKPLYYTAVLWLSLLAWTDLFAASAVVSFTPPTQYCDGSPLADGDIEVYELYVSESSPGMTGLASCGNNASPPQVAPITIPGDQTSHTITLDQNSTYYVVLRAQDVNGLWSQFTDETAVVVPGSNPLQPGISITINADTVNINITN